MSHGTASELERKLAGDDGKSLREAQRLLSWPAACGSYLARLAKADRPHVAGRVTARPGGGGVKIWTIAPPSAAEVLAEATGDVPTTAQGPSSLPGVPEEVKARLVFA